MTSSPIQVGVLGARRKLQGGFTLIEIIVVVAIIALLAASIIPVVAGQIAKAKITSQQADLKEIAEAYNRYFTDTSQWPGFTAGTSYAVTPAAASTVSWGALTGANSLWVMPGTLTAALWKGPYLNTSAQFFNTGAANGVADRWGRAYQYYYASPVTGGAPGSIVLISGGPNGVVDTTQAQVTAAAGSCPNPPVADDICYVVTQRMQ